MYDVLYIVDYVLYIMYYVLCLAYCVGTYSANPTDMIVILVISTGNTALLLSSCFCQYGNFCYAPSTYKLYYCDHFDWAGCAMLLWYYA